ncbi:MAG: Asp-tRNA(Asn)/Glu-tRNA(Gln) amidotransferase subunit GatC [Bacillota bacterium]|jgi:aspartyl-tRNA(Asn)/glutamyl-tRNA(Gln) amidotransferase subunit C
MRIDVKHVADLARMRLSPGEAAKIEKDLESILRHIDRLSEIDVEGVEPTFGFRGAKGVVLEEDTPRPGLNRDRLLEIAPEVRDGYYVVPKEAPASDDSGEAPPGGRR